MTSVVLVIYLAVSAVVIIVIVRIRQSQVKRKIKIFITEIPNWFAVTVAVKMDDIIIVVVVVVATVGLGAVLDSACCSWFRFRCCCRCFS